MVEILGNPGFFKLFLHTLSLLFRDAPGEFLSTFPGVFPASQAPPPSSAGSGAALLSFFLLPRGAVAPRTWGPMDQVVDISLRIHELLG